MRKNKLAYALALTPLLLGAGGTGSIRQELKVTSLSPKSCDTGQYLMFQGGKLTCGTVSGGPSIGVQNCTGQLLTNQSGGSDVPQLSCTARGQGSISVVDANTVTRILSDLTIIDTTLTNLEKTPPAAGATFVGVTKIASKGNFIAPVGVTADRGFHSATALCSVDYVGSHLCSVYEIYRSIYTGKLRLVADPNAVATKVDKAWLYFPGWNNPVSSTFEPNNGLNDDCGNGTYDTGDKAWKGIGMTWNVDAMSNGAFGLKFLGGAQTSCATAMPLACCK